ncbi:uncharacterized protein I206_105898 [Kwoniella pini CBS 10737]|uniref:Signal transducer n=1 Tax=Kwoniella pini CBS 10737 TaxID=1296096 RepID=A0A1B9I0H4_9TREE|nr:signal transducer [Kwoniella pini CBS 10737]OCF49032.1 signal transducer [Kwoniella pini CBS 10737]
MSTSLPLDVPSSHSYSPSTVAFPVPHPSSPLIENHPPTPKQNNTTTPSTSAPAVLSPRVPSPSNIPPPTSINGQSSTLLKGNETPTTKTGDSLPNLGELDAKCGGCHEVIDQESGGVVVAFGSSLWHVDCFKCAKCKNKVSADTNLLLLSDGSPVCGNCSYQCFVCKQAITEEAIMTGDESYHAHCFTCRTCKRRIEELVFAKTSQGIYCMACHNERVARSRRHAEHKRQKQARKEERERERREKHVDGERKREEDQPDIASPIPVPAGKFLQSTPGIPSSMSLAQFANSPTGSPSATPNSFNTGKFDTPNHDSGISNAGDAFEDAAERDSSREREREKQRDLSVDRTIQRSTSPANRRAVDQDNMPLPSSPSDPNRGVTHSRSMDSDHNAQGRQGSHMPSPSLGSSRSINDSIPVPAAGPSKNAGLGVGPVGLNVPTSKAERRRSINPAMTFNMDAQNSTFNVEPRMSPLPPSPLRASFTDLKEQQQQQQEGQGLQPLRSPTTPSPSPGNDMFPFRERQISAGGAMTTQDQGSSGPPPRTSSLPDQLASGKSRPLATIEDEDSTAGGSRKSSIDNTALSSGLPSKQPSNNQLSEGAVSTPRLNAPNLPPMSFSLSDPDFAVILNNIDQSPTKKDKIAHKSGESIVIVKAEDGSEEPIEDANAHSSPISTNDATSPSIARSPQMDMLSSAAATTTNDAGAGAGMEQSGSLEAMSRSPSRLRLSPNDQVQTPQMLRIRQASADSTISINSRYGSGDGSFNTLVELVAGAKHRGEDKSEVDLSVLTGVIQEIEELRDTITGLKSKYTGAKRTSQQYSEGLTIAGEEYDKELAHRRELEAEVSRLRAQVHSQTARLSVISGDERRAENMRRRSNDLANNLTGLERDISRLRAQRDMSLAEVEELHARRASIDSFGGDDGASSLSRSLTNRLDTIKEQYREELEPLTAQREALQRDIAELRETKESFLEESAALAAKNEELAELNASLSRQAESVQDHLSRIRPPTIFGNLSGVGKNGPSGAGRSHPSGSPSLSSLATSATLQEVPEETARVVKVTKPEPLIEAAPARRFKWYKSSKGPDSSSASASISKPLNLPTSNRNPGLGVNLSGAGNGGPGGPNGNLQRPSTEFGFRDHSFAQHSTMRLTRCELCQEKMWGLQEVKCSSCGIVCHFKCAEKLPRSCTGSRNGTIEHMDGPLPPSMFGRDLIEQVGADKTAIPGIVTKCIHAVEAVGMEYEGIYRKTGGSSQSKQITQLFERGDYDAFDLTDLEIFNDISSVTSVLKTYFRSLPNPLLTHALHESFVAAASIRDTNNKHSALCALLKELPKEHYNTLRTLMLHLNRVTALSSVNLMTSQNLGVVFGPTLMRSADPNREFGDMAGKALSVQWMVDNAPQVFIERD